MITSKIAMTSPHQGRAGFSLIEILVGLGIAGVLMTALMSLTSIFLKQQNQSNVTFQADLFRKNLVVLINNNSAWSKTISAPANSPPFTVSAPYAVGTLLTAPIDSGNPGLSCLVGEGSPCTDNGKDLSDTPAGAAISGMAINQIFDQSGTVFYDSTSPTSGLTSQGTPCTGFSATTGSGSDACPLRFNIAWTAICGSSCLRPQVQLVITPIYNPKSNDKVIAFNPSNYGAKFIQQGSLGESSSSTLGPITWF